MTNKPLYKVTENYGVAYPNPIHLQIGEEVPIIKRETNQSWIET